MLSLLGLGCLVALGVAYNKHKTIQGLLIDVIQEDTWFVNRDDNKKIAIVVSLSLTNKTTRQIKILNCKLSGYFPKDNPSKIYLQTEEDNTNNKIWVDFPKYEQFIYGKPYVINPFSNQKIWVYYESRAITMSNLFEVPIFLKSFDKKRKSAQVRIPRHPQQLMIYAKSASLWS